MKFPDVPTEAWMPTLKRFWRCGGLPSQIGSKLRQTPLILILTLLAVIYTIILYKAFWGLEYRNFKYLQQRCRGFEIKYREVGDYGGGSHIDWYCEAPRPQ